MTQQKIIITKSSDMVWKSFYTHIKNAIFSDFSKGNSLELSELHNALIDNHILKEGSDQATLFHNAVYSSFDQPNFYSTDFWINYKKICLEMKKLEFLSE